MVTIHNKQRKIKVDTKKIQAIAHKMLTILNYSDFDIGILLTNNKNIRVYNRTYRHKDTATDILSFSYHPAATPGKRIKVVHEEDTNLGDLILSLEYIKEQAEKLKISLDERIKILLAHGICHLLGYDHETDSDWRAMRAKEAFILKRLDAQRSADSDSL